MQPFAGNVTSALSIVQQTSVPDVLPSGQCFKRCRAKDNVDVIRSLPANGHIHTCLYKPFVD